MFLFIVTRVATRELKPQPVIIANAPNETKNVGIRSKQKTTHLSLLGAAKRQPMVIITKNSISMKKQL